MNVLVMGNFLYPHGMAGTKRVQHFIDYLQKQEANVRVLLLRQGGTKIPINELEGYFNGVYYVTIGNSIQFAALILLKILVFFVKGTSLIIKWREWHSNNILYVYGGPNLENIWFVIVAKLIGYKIVFDVVEDYSVDTGNKTVATNLKIKSMLWLESYMHFIANGIVVISTHLKKKYDNIVQHCVPVVMIPVSATVAGVPEKRTYNTQIRIVYSGSFGDKDGVDILIKAFKEACKFDGHVRLFLTGKGDKTNIDRIKNVIADNPSITYLGYLDDETFYDFIKCADILCMTRIETQFANAGFPFKLGEYLATGNPVVASDIGDVSHYLVNMKDAVLVRPGDSDELKQAIKYLINHPTEGIQIGEAGRIKCSQYFNPEINARMLVDLLCSL